MPRSKLNKAISGLTAAAQADLEEQRKRTAERQRVFVAELSAFIEAECGVKPYQIIAGIRSNDVQVTISPAYKAKCQERNKTRKAKNAETGGEHE